MTNQEHILEVIEFFQGKELTFKKEYRCKATIRSFDIDRDSESIGVILNLSDCSLWHIRIWVNGHINWLGYRTDNWDLILNGISFKKCIQSGMSSITLYDMIQ